MVRILLILETGSPCSIRLTFFAFSWYSSEAWTCLNTFYLVKNCHRKFDETKNTKRVIENGRQVMTESLISI